MGRGNIITRQLDWFTIGLYLVLISLGWLNIYSASFNEANPNLFDFSQEYGKQFIWMMVCVVLGTLILMMDGVLFTRFAVVIYVGTLLLLIGVLIFGKEVNGAKAWFGVGSFGIQPSEFAKFSTCLVIAKFLSSVNVQRTKVRPGNFIQDLFTYFGSFTSFVTTGGTQLMLSVTKATMVPLTLIAVPAILILLQPDTGTVLVFSAMVFVLYREGLAGNLLLLGMFSVVISVLSLMLKDTYILLPFMSKFLHGQWFLIGFLVVIGLFIALFIKYFVLPRDRKRSFILMITVVLSSAFVVKGVGLVFDHVLQPHQQERIEITLGLKEDPTGAGYNVNQSMAAIGSGGFSGKGYMEGTLSNARNKHVPMQSTDFIFCSIGEEWGFVGGLVTIVLFVTLLIRIIIIAERQRSDFTRIYSYGVASIIFFHFAINIAMTIGLAPVIGIPLPFFSYGGSSLIGFTFLLFIMLRLDAERKDVLR